MSHFLVLFIHTLGAVAPKRVFCSFRDSLWYLRRFLVTRDFCPSNALFLSYASWSQFILSASCNKSMTLWLSHLLLAGIFTLSLFIHRVNSHQDSNSIGFAEKKEHYCSMVVRDYPESMYYICRVYLC